MRRLCAKATDVWAQWVAGRPNSLAGRPHYATSVSFLGGDALEEVVEWNPRLGVDGDRAPWLAGDVARPAGQHLASYQLNQVGICSWDSYKYPLPMEFTHTTLYL
jgi:hypothetical protein